MGKASDDLFFLKLATLYASRATCPRMSVGCVATRDRRVIATGYNGALSGLPHCTTVGCELDDTGSCIRAVHAEANMIAFASKYGISLSDCTLFCTLSPCVSCAKLIAQSGVVRVVFGDKYKDDSGLKVLESMNIEVSQYG